MSFIKLGTYGDTNNLSHK